MVYSGQLKSKTNELSYSGTIEAVQSNLSFQASGIVARVDAREGEAVSAGQLLAELDRAESLTRTDQARATLDKAVKSVEQLGVVLEVYTKTLPAEVARAEAAVATNRYTAEDAGKNKERFEQLFEQEGIVSVRDRDAAVLNYDRAASGLAEAEAALKVARSNLKNIDVARHDLEAAKSQVQVARAALAQADVQLAYTRLTAPYGGIITSRDVEPGEVVTPGREVMTLADLSRINLKIFVGETEIGKVKPGQKVDVRVDTFPGKVYNGVVSFVSPEGEFTPKIIQTRKERVKLVYLVKVSIPNPALELKTGMPADAWLR
jgi:HlyD family secretion protein